MPCSSSFLHSEFRTLLPLCSLQRWNRSSWISTFPPKQARNSRLCRKREEGFARMHCERRSLEGDFAKPLVTITGLIAQEVAGIMNISQATQPKFLCSELHWRENVQLLPNTTLGQVLTSRMASHASSADGSASQVSTGDLAHLTEVVDLQAFKVPAIKIP
jgi:hypothetical protein